jgi:hypothetical protein
MNKPDHQILAALVQPRQETITQLPSRPSRPARVAFADVIPSPQLRAEIGAMRPIAAIVGLLFLAGPANAIECQSSPPPSNKGHWAWRLIDDKKCWYAGEPGMDKSRLHWARNADRAPEPAQRTAPEPAQRTAPEPAQRTAPEPAQRTAPEPAERTTLPPAPRTQPAVLPSAEAQPWSTFGMGLAVPASDIDWAARWPSANIEPSAIPTPAASDGVATQSNTPPRDHAPASRAALIGTLIFVLATLYTLAAWAFSSRKRLPRSRSRQIVHIPPSAPKLLSMQIKAEPRENQERGSRQLHRVTKPERLLGRFAQIE